MKNKNLIAQLEKYRKYLIWGGVILLLGAGYFYFREKKATQTTTPSSPEQIFIQENGMVKKSNGQTESLSEDEIRKLREEIDGVLSMGGEIVNFKNVAGTSALGEAKRAYSDGKYYFKATASHLESVDKGFYYECFLKNGDTYLSIGRMEMTNSGGGALYYSTSVNRLEYNEVVITLEPEDGNPTPATPILEASF